jgi:hypothetical protein
MTTLVQLDGEGPFQLPIAVACSGLVLLGGQLPVQLHLNLVGGRDIYLPVEEEILHKIHDLLADMYPEWGKLPPVQE